MATQPGTRPSPLKSPLGSAGPSPKVSPVAPTPEAPRRAARRSPAADTTGRARRSPAATTVDEVLLEAQVVKVEWPGQNPKPLAVWLDLEERCLNLQQVSLAPKTRKLEFGGGTSVNFDQISDIHENARSLEIRGPGNIALVRLVLDTDEELQTWSRGFRIALNDYSSVTTSDEVLRDNALVETARALIKEQEGRLSKLKQLTTHKDEHLLKLHNQLEEALGILQGGQKMYSEQQHVVETQQQTINRLKEALREKGATSPQCGEESNVAPRAAAAFRVAEVAAKSNAKASPTGKTTAARTSTAQTDSTNDVDDLDLIEQDSKMVALLRRTEELQKAAADASVVARSHNGAPPEIMAHLSALIKEKDELEATLKQEQAALEAELRSLQAFKQ